MAVTPVAARAPVMSDVARLAGVSLQTVSRVVNHARWVRPDTAERVHRAIEELGFRPNATARALATRRTHTLGVITRDHTNHGPAATQQGIEAAARDAGYLLVTIGVPDLSPTALSDAVHRLQSHGVEGIAVLSPTATLPAALAMADVRVPLVAMDPVPEGVVPVVTADETAGARAVVGHLLSLGHPTVHHLGGQPGSPPAEARLGGWRTALTAAGARVPDVVIGDWTADAGYRAGAALTGPDVSAVFVANDQMALGLLHALRDADRPVPDRVSVVGWDDIPGARHAVPALTTVRQDFAAAGAQTVRLLLDLVRDPAGAPDNQPLPTALVVRKSTAPYQPTTVRADPVRRLEEESA